MKRIKVVLGSLVAGLSLVPALAFAAAGDVQLSTLGKALQDIQALMNKVVPILIGLAIIAFLFGVLRFVFNAGKEDKRAEGRNFMIYGLIGIVVMVSVWGLVTFVQSTFGLQNNNFIIQGPQLPN
jgi:hypothetical protein